MRRTTISKISSNHDSLWLSREYGRMSIYDRVEIEECLGGMLTIAISSIDEWDTGTSLCFEDITLLTRSEGDDICK